MIFILGITMMLAGHILSVLLKPTAKQAEPLKPVRIDYATSNVPAFTYTPPYMLFDDKHELIHNGNYQTPQIIPRSPATIYLDGKVRWYNAIPSPEKDFGKLV